MTEPASVTRQVFLGRQPIFDRDRQVTAYELLYRHSGQTEAAQRDDRYATSVVMVDALMSIGLDRLVGSQRAFLNMDTASLVAELPLSLPPQRVVIEVLETVAPEPDVLAALRHLRERGYRIALDDVVYQPALDPLLELADIVKVDLPAVPADQLPGQVAELRRFGVQLLAEKVETRAQFERTQSLGFTLFQGYWLARPKTLSGSRGPAERGATLQLAARLQDPTLETRELYDLVRHNAGLSHRLLRYINSATFYLTRRIDSLRQAVVLLGQRQIRQIASLLLLDDGDTPPLELLRLTLVRARLCEQLARARKLDPDTAFTVGLFSTADLLLDQPLAKVLADLPLSQAVTRAILLHEGGLGRLLEAVVAYENGRFDHPAIADLAGVDLTGLYLDAVDFTQGLIDASR
ncbi:MAG: EAL and HDOD domain-containing protein [Pseudomonadota bacterium]|jgi:EAL and modified HD-GYP domain-containing signal transduction protein